MHQKVATLIAAASIGFAMACGQPEPRSDKPAPRSDIGLTAAVKTRLIEDATVKAYQVDVDSSNNVVTLSGTVGTAAAKQRAVTLASQIDGVREVVDQIAVDPKRASAGDVRDDINILGQQIREETQQAADAAKRVAQGAGDEAREAKKEAAGQAPAKVGQAADKAQIVLTDAAITSAVKTKFLADTAVSGLKIDVDTHGGVVTLKGTVATRGEATRAIALARDTAGVERVVDQVKVEGK
jgi:hyperosmotically inducible protein